METTTVRYNDVDLEVTGEYEGMDPDVGQMHGSFELHRVELDGVDVSRLLDGLRDVFGHPVIARLTAEARRKLDEIPRLTAHQSRSLAIRESNAEVML